MQSAYIANSSFTGLAAIWIKGTKGGKLSLMILSQNTSITCEEAGARSLGQDTINSRRVRPEEGSASFNKANHLLHGMVFGADRSSYWEIRQNRLRFSEALGDRKRRTICYVFSTCREEPISAKHFPITTSNTDLITCLLQWTRQRYGLG